MTQVSLYHTVKTICVAILLIELQSPMVSVGNTIRTQMFHDESTRSKQINQLKILTAELLKDTTIKRNENPKTANETQHKHAIQNHVMYAQCSALSAPGPMCAMKYALAHIIAPAWFKLLSWGLFDLGFFKKG